MEEQGSQVADRAKHGTQLVAGVAADEVKGVVAEAGTQASSLLGEARSQLTSQASTQQSNAASWMTSLASRLTSMVEKASDQNDSQPGPATELVRQVSERAHSAAARLENHEPSDLPSEATRFARQRPGIFLQIAGRRSQRGTADARPDRRLTR